MIRVLIADDHVLVRKGLKMILKETPDIALVEEAGSAQEVLKKVWETDFDVVLLDISMPGRSGLDTIKQLKSERPALHVLVLTLHPEESYAIRALKAGASGYMTKERTPHELIKAIRKVSSGKKYVSPSLAERLLFYLDDRGEKPIHETISDREFEVMCMIASGKTVKEIAEELSLSVKTVSTYRTRILEKMKMKNNAQLMYYAMQNRLVSGQMMSPGMLEKEP